MMCEETGQPEGAETRPPEDFRVEARRCWQAMPDKGLFFALLVPWLVVFQLMGNSTFGYYDTHSLFAWLANAYNSVAADDSHGFLIPVVVLGLMWWKRDELLEVSKCTWAPGLSLLAMGALLHVVGYVVQQPRISTVALFVGIYGIMGTVWGYAWLRATFFPFVLFVFCVPIGSLADTLTVPLRILVAKLSVGISRVVLGIDVIQDGSRIFNPGGSFQYDVAPACSGIRSLIALMIITLISSFVLLETHWKRLVALLVAVPVAVAGNVLRITVVIMAAEAFGQEAGLKVHDHAWVLTWGLAVGAMWALFSWLRKGPAGEGIERREVAA